MALRPYRPASRLIPARTSACILAGIAFGQILVVALDAKIGGPGPFVLFGL